MSTSDERCTARLRGERREIGPFLGSCLLEEAIDGAGCDRVIHGHCHRGVESGRTSAGAPGRNVALPVIRDAYRVDRPVARSL